MEINKVQFESMKSLGITQSFDDLDVNKDGVISDADKDNASEEVAKVIGNLISAANADGEVTEDLNGDTLVDDIDKILKNYDEVIKTGETDNTTGELSEEDKAKLAELKEQLAKVNARIDEINAEIATLEARNAELAIEQEKLLKEQEEAQAAADEANEKLEQEQATLETYTKEYDNYQQEIEALNKEILKEQEREEEEFKTEMNIAVKDAINNYDPANDGDDFNVYFAKKLDEVGFPTFTKLNSLNWDAEALSDAAEGVLRNIMTQSSIVSTAKAAADLANSNLADVNAKLKAVNDEITANNTKMDTLKAELTTKQNEAADIKKEINKLQPPVPGSGLSGDEVLKLISEQEKCFAKELGWKLEDCIVAIGEDKKFHIYNPNVRWPGDEEWMLCSTRAYFYEKTGNCRGGESLSITPEGSGSLSYNSCLMNTYGNDNNQNSVIYKFSSVNEDWTEGCACESSERYITVSPLSFDVNGDGMKTTEETVSFDIDGDGELDTVNNSAEWVLAFDKDKDGIAGEDGSELFGNNTDLDGDGVGDGYANGFEALKALAQKEGLIGNGDSVLDKDDIAFLADKYGLTMTNGYGGEAKSLVDLGITEINLAETDETTLEKNFDGRNNDIMRQEGATFTVNGETREYADIWNAKKGSDEKVTKNAPKVVAKAGKESQVKTNLKDVTLDINQHGVVALKGEVNFKFIKDKSESDANIPNDILEEVVELKEDEEEV